MSTTTLTSIYCTLKKLLAEIKASSAAAASNTTVLADTFNQPI